MKRKAALVLLMAILTMLLVTPSLAFAGGDQVNRPDGSGTAEQQAGGELPDWAPREQQDPQP
jgi:hypothetical protein